MKSNFTYFFTNYVLYNSELQVKTYIIASIRLKLNNYLHIVTHIPYWSSSTDIGNKHERAQCGFDFSYCGLK